MHCVTGATEVLPGRPTAADLPPVVGPHPATSHSRTQRIVACLLVDVSVLAGAFWLAFLLRYDGAPPPRMAEVMLFTLPLVVLLQYALLAWRQVPRFSWSLVSIRDLPPIVYALSAAGAVLLLLRYGCGMLVEQVPSLRMAMIPASVVLLATVLSVLGIAGVRCARRLYWQRTRRLRRRAEEATPVILIGAGVGGGMLLHELTDRVDLGLEPVAFVDDDPRKQGLLINGIRVAGTTAQLAQVAQRYGAGTALIAIAGADGGALHRIVDRCKAAGLKTKIVPPIHEIVSGKVRISQIRDVAIEDLLGREPVEIVDSAAPMAVTGKVALVTGAGGSIGSELCRQIVRLRPRLLVLVERCECNLYQIHRELEANDQGVPVVPVIADVCDGPRMEQVFGEHRPHVVFHAAAHKHVPMMERHPGEAIKNNVFGTKSVADLADRSGAERFILVSTDKAVNPSSVMGATKRLAELYIKDLNARSKVRFASVRFGNVMGSAGSVIPLFREQIASGGPVTVTHPEMERFFMTIPEASRLVLEASGLCRGGEVMILDMGKPVKIRDLAEQMIRLSGFEPGVQIKIAYTGMRPGEKLQEQLALPEEMIEETRCQKLFVWRGATNGFSLALALEQLRAPGNTAEEIRETLHRVLPEYRRLESVRSA